MVSTMLLFETQILVVLLKNNNSCVMHQAFGGGGGALAVSQKGVDTFQYMKLYLGNTISHFERHQGIIYIPNLSFSQVYWFLTVDCRVDDSDGLRREFEILTLSIQQWHILEYDHLQMDENSYGQLHEGDTYVVRWHYVISQKGEYFTAVVSGLVPSHDFFRLSICLTICVQKYSNVKLLNGYYYLISLLFQA